jgi:hypothetical protein
VRLNGGYVLNQEMQVLTSHKSCEWYTPVRYIELAKAVLHSIDLDPASGPVPQSWIKANRIFTEEDNGLKQEWKADTIWLNPPYGKTLSGKSCQDMWSKKMIQEYETGHFKSGILLVNSTHGYKWYEELWTRYPVCIARERIRFINEDGTVGGQAKRGQTFVYFGKDEGLFDCVFQELGRIIRP